MSRLFTGIVRPFESRDVAPLSVGGKTTKTEEEPKTVVMIWGKGAGNAQVLNATFSASVANYMEKQQREDEKESPTGGDKPA